MLHSTRVTLAFLMVALMAFAYYVAPTVQEPPGVEASWRAGEPLPDGVLWCNPTQGSDPVNGVPGRFQVEALTIAGTHYLSHPEFGLMLYDPEDEEYEDLHGNTFQVDPAIAALPMCPTDPNTGEIMGHVWTSYTQSHADGSGHSGWTEDGNDHSDDNQGGG